MNVTSAPATLQFERHRRFGLIAALAALAAGVAVALSFKVDWQSTKSQGNTTPRASVLVSTGSWSGLVDPATRIPLSAGLVGVPSSTMQGRLGPQAR
jgi:hypothetical protein